METRGVWSAVLVYRCGVPLPLCSRGLFPPVAMSQCRNYRIPLQEKDLRSRAMRQSCNKGLQPRQPVATPPLTGLGGASFWPGPER